MSLTKSLHTVTSVTQVARFLLSHPTTASNDGNDLARRSLNILGYPYTNADWRSAVKNDDTVTRCVRACEKLLAHSHNGADARKDAR